MRPTVLLAAFVFPESRYGLRKNDQNRHGYSHAATLAFFPQLAAKMGLKKNNALVEHAPLAPEPSTTVQWPRVTLKVRFSQSLS